MSISKVSDSVSQWQGHLLSCSGQLKMVKGKLCLYKLCLLWCVCCDKYELCAASLEICSDNQMQTSLELWRHVCITHATKVHLINCYIIFSVCFWPKIRANYVVIGETLYWCFSIKNIAHWKCFQMSLFCQIINCCSKLQKKFLECFLPYKAQGPNTCWPCQWGWVGWWRQRQRQRQDKDKDKDKFLPSQARGPNICWPGRWGWAGWWRGKGGGRPGPGWQWRRCASWPPSEHRTSTS